MPTTKKKVAFWADEVLITHLKEEAARTGASLSEIIRRAIMPPPVRKANYAMDQETR